MDVQSAVESLKVEAHNNLLRLDSESRSFFEETCRVAGQNPNKHFFAAHEIYYRFCQRVYSFHDKPKLEPTPVSTQGYEIARGLLGKATIQNLKNEIDSYMASQDPDVLEWEVARKQLILEQTGQERFLQEVPLRASSHNLCVKTVQEVFTKQVGMLIESSLGSFYYVNHILLSRAFPSSKPSGSFLWHRDFCSPSQMHLMIYLSDAPASGVYGSTEFLSAKDSQEIEVKSNYGFVNAKDRVKDLNDLKTPNSWNSRIHRTDLKAGDGVIFYAGKVLHRGIAPLQLHRDTITFVLSPSLNPWDAELQVFDQDLFLKRSCTYSILMNDPAVI